MRRKPNLVSTYTISEGAEALRQAIARRGLEMGCHLFDALPAAGGQR